LHAAAISSCIKGCGGVPVSIMLLVTVTMYMLSIASWVVTVSTLLEVVYDTDDYTFIRLGLYVFKSRFLTICLGINIWLGDSILLWRTCILWSESKKVKIIACFLQSVVIVFGITDVVTTYQQFSSSNSKILNYASPASNIFGSVSLLVSLTINVWSSYLTLAKSRRLKKFHARLALPASTETRLLSFLVICSFVYNIFWCAFVIIATPITQARAWTIPCIIMSACATQVTGIYPTFVIIVACLRQSGEDEDDDAGCSPPNVSTPALATVETSGEAIQEGTVSGSSLGSAENTVQI